MTSRVLPPDVVFAQKASAVVKAAGYDPRAIDLENFRAMAPEIFTRAYQAIYKERLPISEGNEANEDRAINCQFVIESLLEKTGNAALEQITGVDVVDGSHKAIGYLVGVLFAEGQRMWLAKREGGVSNLQQQPRAGTTEAQNQNSPSKRRIKKQSKKDHSSGQKEYLDNPNIEVQNTSEAHFQPINPATVPTREIEGLLDRIKYLEQQLTARGVTETLKDPTELESKPSREDDAANLQIESDAASGQAQQDDSSKPATVQRKKRPLSARRRQEIITHRLYTARGHSAHLANVILPVTGAERENVDESLPARPRPRSPVEGKDTVPLAFGSSMGRAGLIAKLVKESEEQRAIVRPQSAQAQRPQSAGAGGRPNRPRPSSASHAGPSSPSSHPHAPVAHRPEGPGPRIEQGIDNWVNKIRSLREQEEKVAKMVKVVNKPADLNPRFFGAYNRLDKMDLVISVEHCHSCEHHNFSLRHDPRGYTKTADSTLRALAQIVHEANLCVRLGVIRFRAKIALKPHLEDANSRIGAFEVQVAYRNKAGQIQHELLHSKLVSQRWPAKSVLEKRLTTFFSKARVNSFVRDANGLYTQTAVDGSNAYPVGSGPWESTALADPFWEFTPGSSYSSSTAQAAASAAAGCDGEEAQRRLRKVQWVFDSRALAEKPALAVGSTVRVSSLSHPKGGVERHALLGVIKSFPKVMHLWQPTVTIRLKYHSNEVTVATTDCTPLNEYIDRDPDYNADEMPRELEALLLMANGYSLGCAKSLEELERQWGIGSGGGGNGGGNGSRGWYVMSGEDSVGSTASSRARAGAAAEVSLSRSSFFHQVRDLVGEVEAKERAAELEGGVWGRGGGGGSGSEPSSPTNASAAGGGFRARHPVGGSVVDLQLAYSEEVLDWVFGRYGAAADMAALEVMAGKAIGLFATSPAIAAAWSAPAAVSDSASASGLAAAAAAAAADANDSSAGVAAGAAAAGPGVSVPESSASSPAGGMKQLLLDSAASTSSPFSSLDEADANSMAAYLRERLVAFVKAAAQRSPRATPAAEHFESLLREVDPLREGKLSEEGLSALLQLTWPRRRVSVEDLKLLWKTVVTSGGSAVSSVHLARFTQIRPEAAATDELGSIWTKLRHQFLPTGDSSQLESFAEFLQDRFNARLDGDLDFEGSGNLEGLSPQQEGELPVGDFMAIADMWGVQGALADLDLDLLTAAFSPINGDGDGAVASGPSDSRSFRFVDFLVWLSDVATAALVAQLQATVADNLGEGADGVESFLSLLEHYAFESGTVEERDFLSLCKRLRLKFAAHDVRALMLLEPQTLTDPPLKISMSAIAGLLSEGAGGDGVGGIGGVQMSSSQTHLQSQHSPLRSSSSAGIDLPSWNVLDSTSVSRTLEPPSPRLTAPAPAPVPATVVSAPAPAPAVAAPTSPAPAPAVISSLAPVETVSPATLSHNLKIKNISCTGLANVGLGLMGEKNAVMVVLTIPGATKPKQQTAAQVNAGETQADFDFDDIFEFTDFTLDAKLKIAAFDKKTLIADVLIGEVDVDLKNAIADGKERMFSCEIKDGKGKQTGRVVLSIQLYPTDSPPAIGESAPMLVTSAAPAAAPAAVAPTAPAATPAPIAAAAAAAPLSAASAPSATQTISRSTAAVGINSLPDDLQVGDEVECRYGSSMDWFPGKIEKIHKKIESLIDGNSSNAADAAGDVHYDVAYDDGDSEANVSRRRLRRVGEQQLYRVSPSGQAEDEDALPAGLHVDARCKSVVTAKVLEANSNCLPGVIESVAAASSAALAEGSGGWVYNVRFDLTALGIELSSGEQVVTEQVSRKWIFCLHGAEKNHPQIKPKHEQYQQRLAVAVAVAPAESASEQMSQPATMKSGSAPAPAPADASSHRRVVFAEDLESASSAADTSGALHQHQQKEDDEESPTAQLVVGSVVEANYCKQGEWYPGKVTRDRGDGTFDIAYDDGESEMRVKKDMIRLWGAASPVGERDAVEYSAEAEEGAEVNYNEEQTEAALLTALGGGGFLEPELQGDGTVAGPDDALGNAYDDFLNGMADDDDFEDADVDLNGLKAAPASGEDKKLSGSVGGGSAGGAQSAEIELDELEVGEEVEVRYMSGSEWFPGVIDNIYFPPKSNELNYDVQYNDGDREEGILRRKIRRQGDVQVYAVASAGVPEEPLPAGLAVDAVCMTLVKAGVLSLESSILPGVVMRQVATDADRGTGTGSGGRAAVVGRDLLYEVAFNLQQLGLQLPTGEPRVTEEIRRGDILTGFGKPKPHSHAPVKSPNDKAAGAAVSSNQETEDDAPEFEEEQEEETNPLNRLNPLEGVHPLQRVELPKDLLLWRNLHVQAWLGLELELPQYVPAFREASVDGPVLFSDELFNEEVVGGSLGITNEIHRKKIMISIAKLRVDKNFAEEQEEESKGPEAPVRRVLKELYRALGGASWVGVWDADETINWKGDVPLDEWQNIVVTRFGGGQVTVSELALASTGLRGSLPPSLGQLQGLTIVDLSYNYVEGSIPAALGHLSLLSKLNLSHNSLSGTIPDALANLSSLEALDLSFNTLSGKVPAQLARLPNLKQLLLHENNLSGPLPAGLADLASLSELQSDLVPYVDFNKVCEWLRAQASFHWPAQPLQPEQTPTPEHHSEIKAALTCFYDQADRYNLGTADDEEDADFDEANALLSVGKSLNPTKAASIVGSGKRDKWAKWGSNAPLFQWAGLTLNSNLKLQSLVLRKCDIAGNIPPDIGVLSTLVYLDLSSNKLTGGLPEEIANLTDLRHLHLDDNQLDGSGFDPLTSLSLLKSVNLSSNCFTGFIPQEIGNLTALQELVLHKNKFDGPLPGEVGQLSSLRTLTLASNSLTGFLPSDLSSLTSLEHLDLSSNQFTGALPEELGACASLRYLCLSHNALTGALPDSLAGLSCIEELLLAGTQVEAPGGGGKDANAAALELMPSLRSFMI